MKAVLFAALAFITVSNAHQGVLKSEEREPWMKKYGDQYDLAYTGVLSFSHIPYHKCLEDPSLGFDIAILGMPFDTGVSYRPGARFGPYAIRSGSRRQAPTEAYSLNWMSNPYATNAKIIDCGDIPISPFDNALAVDQIETAYTTLLARPISNEGLPGARTHLFSKDGIEHPRIITLGGDHTIVLPILRSLNEVYGPISVLHFDAHIDTWTELAGVITKQSRVTHGTFFTIAFEEGLVANSSIHAGIRTKLKGPELLDHDAAVGFQLVTTDDLDDIGTNEIIKKIRKRLGNNPVYLSFDIDTIDPGQAPATGTPEPAGWTAREVKRIIRGLGGLNFVGADLVEVAPAYDNADITGILAADLVHDFLTLFNIDRDTSPVEKQRRRSEEEL